MDLKNIVKSYPDFKFLGDRSNINLKIRAVHLLSDINTLRKLSQTGGQFFIMTEDFFELHIEEILKFIGGGYENLLGIRSDQARLPNKILEDIAIIGIPSHYDLEDLVVSILNNISIYQDQVIRENDMINRVFMKMNIEQSSIEEYMDFLSKTIKKDLIYYGKMDSIIHSTGDWFIPYKSLGRLKERDLRDYYYVKIEQHSQLYGYIIINDLGDNMDEKNKLLVDYTANMILIKIQNQIAVENSKEIVRSDLIADLCMDNVKSKEEVSFRAGLQGWQIDSGLLAVIFDIDEYKHSMLYSNKNIEELEEEKQVIFSLIVKEMEKIEYSSYFYRKSDSIIFLVNVDLENNFSQLDEFINTNIKPIHKTINDNDFNFTLTIGIGTYYADIMQTYKSYNEAIEAINISRVFKGTDDISYYKDVVIFKDLMEVMTKKDYNSIYINMIKEIIQLDKDNKTEYFKTLKCIIKNDWNLKNSSKELYIHYNTIIYRYEKIKELLAMDLSDFYEKLIITLTVMILEVEKHIDFNKGMFKKQLNI